jgi:hypothetical protein
MSEFYTLPALPVQPNANVMREDLSASLKLLSPAQMRHLIQAALVRANTGTTAPHA